MPHPAAIHQRGPGELLAALPAIDQHIGLNQEVRRRPPIHRHRLMYPKEPLPEAQGELPERHDVSRLDQQNPALPILSHHSLMRPLPGQTDSGFPVPIQ